MTRPPLRSLWTFCIVLATAVLLAAGVPAMAASSTGQAKREMEIGYDAARHGYWQEALMRFQRADALTPGQPRILNNLAVAQEATGDFDGALLTYEAAIEADPGNSALQKNYKLFKQFYQENVVAPEPEPEPPPAPDDRPSAPPGDVTDEGGGR